MSLLRFQKFKAKQQPAASPTTRSAEPRLSLQAWNEMAEGGYDSWPRHAQDELSCDAVGRGTLGASHVMQKKFDGYLSDGSQGSSMHGRSDTSKECDAAIQRSGRKYLNRHVSTEIDRSVSPELTESKWRAGTIRPSWGVFGRRLSLSAPTSAFARAPAKVPREARMTGASLSTHRPPSDEMIKTHKRMSWLSTVKVKLSGGDWRRGKAIDQDTVPIARDCVFESGPVTGFYDETEGGQLLETEDFPSRIEPISRYPRLRSQPSLNRPASARQNTETDNIKPCVYSRDDVMFVPEKSSVCSRQVQTISLGQHSRAPQRSQFLLPHRSSINESKSPYAKLDDKIVEMS